METQKKHVKIKMLRKQNTKKVLEGVGVSLFIVNSISVSSVRTSSSDRDTYIRCLPPVFLQSPDVGPLVKPLSLFYLWSLVPIHDPI